VLCGAVEPDGGHDLLTEGPEPSSGAAGRHGSEASRGRWRGVGEAGSRAGTWRQRARQRGRRTRGVCWVLVVSSGESLVVWVVERGDVESGGIWRRNLAEESGDPRAQKDTYTYGGLVDWWW